MSASNSRRIRVPLSERWRDLRLRFIPAFVFLGAACALLVLWKQNLAAPSMLGQVEPVQASVSSYRPGMLAELNVARFQHVKADDAVGQVLVTDPRILASSLAVIQSEIESLRIGMMPIVSQQRTAMDYNQLRVEWMRQRAQLGMSRVSLQLANTDLHRMEELYREKIVSQRVYEQAKASQEKLQSEVTELAQLVDEQATNFEFLQMTNSTDLAHISDAPLRAAIAAQEAKLKLTEAELSPIILRAPFEGTVNVIYKRSGEAITAGEPIITIASLNAVRIISYLRAPVLSEPALRTRVEVRTRGLRRQVGQGEIVEIGSQFEPIAPALQPALKPVAIELGLPIGVSLPSNLKVRPGELVDLSVLPATD